MNGVDHHEFCVICAKPDELTQALVVFGQAFERKQGKRVTDHVYQVNATSTVKLTACSTMGNMHAAVRTAQVVLSSHPHIVFFVGTAASLDPFEVQLGDVVIPRKAVSRVYEKVSEEASSLRMDGVEFEEITVQESRNILISDLATKDCSEEGLSASSALDPSSVYLEEGTGGTMTIGGQEFTLRQPRIHSDIDIFSCGMVVDSISYRDMIKRLTQRTFRKTTVIDMESYGFFRAIEVARSMNVAFECSGLMIRGISDYAGRKRDTEARPDGWKDKAVRNAATVTCALIKQLAP